MTKLLKEIAVISLPLAIVLLYLWFVWESATGATVHVR